MNVFSPEWCRGALQVGLGVLAQSTLLLLLGLLAEHLGRRRGPGFRAFVLQMTLAGVAAGALLSVTTAGRFQPVWDVSLPAATRVSGRGGDPSRLVPRHPPPAGEGKSESHREEKGLRPAPYLSSSYPLPQGEVASLSEPEGSPPTPRSEIIYPALAGVWAGGTSLLLLWLLACQAHLTRLRRRSVPIADAPTLATLHRLCASLAVRPPRLLASPAVRSPFLAGVWRPTILLPAPWEADFDGVTLRVILAHEAAHLARRDCAWTLLLRLTCAALWVQPLLWLLARQLAQATEEACDLLALTPDLPPRRYADCLLALAGRVPPGSAARTLGAGVIPVRSSLGRRIQNVLDRRNQTMSQMSFRFRLSIGLCAAGAVFAGLLLISATAAPKAPVTLRPPSDAIGRLLDARATGRYADAKRQAPFFTVKTSHPIPSRVDTASLSQLIGMQDRAQARLKKSQASLTVCDREFEATLHQALPQADAVTLGHARRIELLIGRAEGSLHTTAKSRTTKIRNHPGGERSTWHHFEVLTEARMRPLLLAEEASLFPATPRPLLAHLHALATLDENRGMAVMSSWAQVDAIKVAIVRRQMGQLPGDSRTGEKARLALPAHQSGMPNRYAQPVLSAADRTRQIPAAGRRAARRETTASRLAALRHSRDSAALQLEVSRKSAIIYEQLAKRAGPHTVVVIDTSSRLALGKLQTQIASAQKQDDTLADHYAPNHPRRLAAQARLDALHREFRALSRQVNQTRTVYRPNPQYTQLKNATIAAKAEAARAQATIAFMDAQIRQLEQVRRSRTP